MEVKLSPAKEPNFDELWNRKRKSSLTNYPVYILSSEDLFLFLVTHGARHGWSRLRWLIDIHQIIKQNLDWSIISTLLEKYHYLPSWRPGVNFGSGALKKPASRRHETAGIREEREFLSSTGDILFGRSDKSTVQILYQKTSRNIINDIYFH